MRQLQHVARRGASLVALAITLIALAGCGLASVTGTGQRDRDTTVVVVDTAPADAPNVIALGNSLTYNQNDEAHGWVAQAAGHFPATWTWHNRGINGTDDDVIFLLVDTLLKPYLSSTRRNVVTYWETRNQIAIQSTTLEPAVGVWHTWRALSAVRQTILRYGTPNDVIILANTIPTSDSVTTFPWDETHWREANALLAAGWNAPDSVTGRPRADYFVDLTTLPEFDSVADTYDRAVFIHDGPDNGIHLTRYGNTRLLERWIDAIARGASFADDRVASIELTAAEVRGSAGTSVGLTATPRGTGGSAIAGRVVTAATSDPAVATVTSYTTDGRLTVRLERAGSTTLYVASGPVKVAVPVVVR